jgi:hypothetical protein
MSRGSKLIDDLIDLILNNLYQPPYTPSGPVLVDENQVVRVSELIYRLPDQDLKSLYNNRNAQHISVRKWIKENKNGERRWIRFVYGLCVAYSILHFLMLVVQHDQVFAELELFRAFSYFFHALIVLAGFIFVVMHREPATLEIGNSGLDFGPARDRVNQSLARASLVSGAKVAPLHINN